MTRRQKQKLLRILLAGVLFACALLAQPHLPALWYLKAACFLVPYLIIGTKILCHAATGIFRGQIFDEDFLMAIASLGAFAIGEYPEAVAVMLFFSVGELFEEYAVGRSRKSIAALMNIRPDVAYVERDGETLETDPEEVSVGDIILIRPGEKIPLDGIILEGSTAVDTSALTGESLPRDLLEGDTVTSGTLNLSGRIRVRVTSPFGESTVSKILELVENAAAKKAKTENFISRFARWYTPIVVISAVLLAVIPSLVTGEWSVWIYRALSFLVTSCPCALVISVPLSFFGGIGTASRRGILIKGGNYMEALAHLDTVVFDKTGTLTKGTFRVTAVRPAEGVTEEEVLTYAALAESGSNHPIARSIVTAFGEELDTARVTSLSEEAGHGIRAVIDGKAVLAGNEKLMQKEKVPYAPVSDTGTVVYVAVKDRSLGAVVISDELKPDAVSAIADLHTLGVRETIMLTGDNEKAAAAIAEKLKLSSYHANLLPGHKVEQVETLLAKTQKGKILAFVGDGINDAPVLSRADLGIAMGAMGSDAAVEAADVVLMDDKPSKIAAACRIAKRTMGIVYFNIVFALGVKLAVLLLTALGITNMWAAVFADVGVSVLAILNAMRIFNTKV